MNKKLALVVVMLMLVLASPSIVAAEEDRDSIQLSLTVFNSLEDFWSSATGMRVPQMMLAIGGMLVLFSAGFDMMWARSRR